MSVCIVNRRDEHIFLLLSLSAFSSSNFSVEECWSCQSVSTEFVIVQFQADVSGKKGCEGEQSGAQSCAVHEVE